jgi:sucrose-6-phosphate hydrolase SacC (GH32 family)
VKKIKLILILGILSTVCSSVYGQLGVKYDPSIQPQKNIQYFKPVGNNLFVGDCMPFTHDGIYGCYWLLDSAHHQSLKGLGGHQWVLSTTTDLKNWKQYPIVLGIDEEWEKSICTGSVVYFNHLYYAFYATRLLNDGKINEQLSYAISKDGIHFEKQKPNPFYTSAPGYSKRNFRDPKVFVDALGEFHLFVSSELENPVLNHAGGCLVHLKSKDLKNWKVLDPILTGQPSVPECPDYFYWKGWYYLVYSDNSNTYYVKSKDPYGPWQQPRYQALNEDWSNVVKTAEFANDRRIAAAWIPSRLDNKDDNHEIFGGNLVFREIMQQPDGTLDTKFPQEMIPETGSELALKIKLDLQSTSLFSNSFLISSPNGVGAAHIENIPLNCRITFEVEPMSLNEEYGLYLRSDDKAGSGYRLNFSAINQMVSLGNTNIKAVSGLDKKSRIDVIIKDDIIDVCIDNKRCIVNRTPEQKGTYIWFYAKHGKVKFNSIKISPLI